jgi:1-acyl-sn-glycerol-3-phosphate acyltransferase
MVIDRLLYWFSRPVVLAYADMMLQMDILHKQKLPAGAKIIAANHPSTTDPFFVAASTRQQTFILIKDLLFRIPVLGAYLHQSGHIPVCAGGGQIAIDKALSHLRAGHTIIIFPEGDLSPMDGGFQKSRTGVARLAIASGAPVIPVGIHLEKSRMIPVCSHEDGKTENGRLYLRGPYHITYGEPLYYHGLVEDRDHVRVVANQIMHHIIELANESQNRMSTPPGGLGSFFHSLLDKVGVA